MSHFSTYEQYMTWYIESWLEIKKIIQKDKRKLLKWLKKNKDNIILYSHKEGGQGSNTSSNAPVDSAAMYKSLYFTDWN